MSTRRVIALLLAVQIGLGIAGLAVWAGAPGVPPTPPPVAVTDATWPVAIESASPVAGEAVAAWLPGAWPMHVAMQIDWPWEAPPPDQAAAIAPTGWIDMVFAAPWTAPGQPPGGATLSLLIERLSGAIVVQSTAAWETAPTTRLPAATPVVSSLAAVATAEAAGGTTFRHACPVNRHVTRISLVARDGTPPYWLVTYEDTRQRERHGLIITVNAMTGEPAVTGGIAPEC